MCDFTGIADLLGFRRVRHRIFHGDTRINTEDMGFYLLYPCVSVLLRGCEKSCAGSVSRFGMEFNNYAGVSRPFLSTTRSMMRRSVLWFASIAEADTVIYSFSGVAFSFLTNVSST